MKGRIAVLGSYAGRQAAALIEAGQLDDFLIAPPEGTPLPGSIYRAIADRPMKGQGGITVRLADGAKGYIRKIKGITPGAALLVQVTGYAEDGKAVPVTDQILFKSRYVIVTPGKPGINLSRAIADDHLRDRLLEIAHGFELPPGAGLIIRSAAEAAAEDEIAEDIGQTANAALAVLGDNKTGGPALLLDGPDPHFLAWRDWLGVDGVETGADSFETTGALDLIEALRTPVLRLPGGASMYIEETRAMVTVDVNTGSDTSLAAGLKASLAAARALPRQLRCRGLGGQIVIDFAPCPKKDRRQIEHALRGALKSDTIDTALAGWTPLGHFEMQRKRERLPLSRCLS